MMSVTSKVRLDTLTPRQRESLVLVAKGMTNAEVGEKLGVKECTIKAHMLQSYKKLKVKNRAKAILLYQKATKKK
jgi:DNA-binding CsgD family transcriptional regulator